MKYKAYSLHNLTEIPQINKLSKDEINSINVVGNVLPFKVNNYVIDELIDWDNYQNDPLFHLTFPQKEMLNNEHYNLMEEALKQTDDKIILKKISDEIRMQLNPHPAGQKELNVPTIDGIPLPGVQHKYRETVLFFPSSGQTCHSYCSFCFRWPQFVGLDELKFAMKETELLVKYLELHEEVTDILFTGGDPMIMSFKVFESYVRPILNSNKTNIQTIRIGTKAFSFWPYKFLTDKDSTDFLKLFEEINSKGINLAFMAHFSHPNELETEAVKNAIKIIRNTGAQIRTQSPLLKHINDSSDVWASMWRKQVNLNCIPYYMFIARDTGAKHYFEVTLEEAWNIFRNAYQKVSGICRTVRGPSMSCTPGKVQVLGISEIENEKIFVLRFLQGRNPDWAARPFFAKYNKAATWLDELQPAFSERFFFEEELESIYNEKYFDNEKNSFE